MEMNRLTREADELIRKVVARYNSLYSPSGTISQTELDLLLDDLRLMYDKFKMIGHLNIQHQMVEQRKTEVTKQASPQETSAIKDQTPSYVSEAKETTSEPPPAIPESQKEEMVEPVASREEATEPETVSTVNDTSRHDPAAKTLADTYMNEKQSLGDVISKRATDDESLGSRLSHAPVSDLKSIIGLAEKFAFINELFGGDPLAYEKAVVQLNSSTRLSEAETYLGTLRLNHKWPTDSPMANLLRDLVRRKFNQ